MIVCLDRTASIAISRTRYSPIAAAPRYSASRTAVFFFNTNNYGGRESDGLSTPGALISVVPLDLDAGSGSLEAT